MQKLSILYTKPFIKNFKREIYYQQYVHFLIDIFILHLEIGLIITMIL